MIAYTRISRLGGRRGEGFVSQEDQADGITGRVRELGLRIVDWAHDPDCTGGNLRRPEWEHAMQRILDLTDPVSGVIVVRVDRFARNVPATAQTAIECFADNAILDTTARSDITPKRLLDGPARTLYLLAPVDRQEDLAPIFALMLDEITTSVYGNGANRPLDPPLLMLLDELANIAPILNPRQARFYRPRPWCPTAERRPGPRTTDARYGHETARTILNNHHAKLILPGSADRTTLDWAASIAGDEEIQQLSRTARAGMHDSKTYSTTFRPLAPAHTVRQLSPGAGLLVYGNLPAATVRLRTATVPP